MVTLETYTATTTSVLKSMSVDMAQNEKGADFALRAQRLNVTTREDGKIDKAETVTQTPRMLSEIAARSVTLTDGTALTAAQIAEGLGLVADQLYQEEIAKQQ